MMCRVPYNGAFLVRKRQSESNGHQRRDSEPVSFAISFRFVKNAVSKVLVTSTLTAYLTPNTRLSTPRPKVQHTQDKHTSAEQLCRALLVLLLPYKNPCCC